MKPSFAIVLFLTGALQGQEPPVLSQAGRIELPNVEGRIDHFTADVKGKRLFMSALDNHTMEVLDVDAGKRIRTLTDLAAPQGAYYHPATNRLFVACAIDGSTKLYDASSFQLLPSMKLSRDADNIRYDEHRQRVVVGYGDGALAFLDLQGKQTGEIPLDGHPESFQLEKGGTRIFVNVPDKKQIEVADLEKNGVCQFGN